MELFTGQFVPFFYKILRQPDHVQQHQEKLLHVMKARLSSTPKNICRQYPQLRDRSAGLQVLDAHLRLHGSKSGSSGFFLGEQYSLAEIAATPHLKRMLVTLPELRKVDPLRMAEENGLSRLVAWMQVKCTSCSAAISLQCALCKSPDCYCVRVTGSNHQAVRASGSGQQ